jgi:4-diphosphocytidyl-2-C-methyl-D-erythritol kinase
MSEISMKSKLALRAPAKINLSLRVTGRRADGYHDLVSLMVPLSFGDELECEKTDYGWSATCDHPDVPVDESSLVGKAFRKSAALLGYSGGMKIHLHKKTPMGAGLGGGSSDAASVMRAVEIFTSKKISESDYPSIAREVGADVPFFLRDGAKWVCGIGDVVTPVEALPEFYLILVNPGVHIATRWVYENLNAERLTSPGTVARKPTCFSKVIELLPYVTNDLESVVLPHHPVIGLIKERLGDLGADAALMSGSGSTIFGLFCDPKTRDKALTDLKTAHPEWWMMSAFPVLY